MTTDDNPPLLFAGRRAHENRHPEAAARSDARQRIRPQRRGQRRQKWVDRLDRMIDILNLDADG